METFKTVLICCAMVLGLVWPAVFLCALSDKLRGYQPPDFTEGEDYEPPPKEPRPWWQHVLFSPLYAVVIVLIAALSIMLIPPMAVLGYAGKFKALVFRRVLRRIV